MADLASAKDFGEFLKMLNIPKPIQNIDYNDYPLTAVAEMSKIQIADSFAMNEDDAAKVVESLSKIINKKEPSSKTGPKKQVCFEDLFEDLSRTPYFAGDQWAMNVLSAAMGTSSNTFDVVFNKLTANTDPKKIANEQADNGHTSLMYAASLGRTQVAKRLITEGANMKLTNNRGQTALMLAAAYGHREIISLFVTMSQEHYPENKVVDVIGLHMRDKEKRYTALHYAAYYAQYDALRELLRFGANPNVADIDGNTPTLLACVDPAVERCLKCLCQKGGDLQIKNNEGMNGFALGNNREAIRIIFDATRRPNGVKKNSQPRYGAF